MTRIAIRHGNSSVELDADRRTDLADLIAAATLAWDHTLPNDGPADPTEFGFTAQTPPHVELSEDR